MNRRNRKNRKPKQEIRFVQRDPTHLKRKVFKMECEVEAAQSTKRAAQRKAEIIGDKWAKEYNRLDEELRSATALIHELRAENVRLRVALTKKEQCTTPSTTNATTP